MDFVIVFFLLDKGQEAESLQKECLFLLCKNVRHFSENKDNDSGLCMNEVFSTAPL